MNGGSTLTLDDAQSNVRDWRSNLPSVEYWRAVPERLPQRFYIAFCLLMSSVQDLILGQKERESNNLNWSATCFYYSLVHGGRLLCFLALGDYPTKHADLRKLLSGRLQRLRSDVYPFDWLRGFTQHRDGRGDSCEPTLDLLEMTVAYLNQVNVPDARQRLNKIRRSACASQPS